MSSPPPSASTTTATGQPSQEQQPPTVGTTEQEAAASNSMDDDVQQQQPTEQPEMLLLSQKWANALPHPHTQCVVSAVCDASSRIHWALHDASSGAQAADFQPSLYWRTTSAPRAILQAARKNKGRGGGASYSDTTSGNEEEEEEDEQQQQQEQPPTAVEFLANFFSEPALRALLVDKRDVPILPSDINKVNNSADDAEESSSTNKVIAEKLLPYWVVQRVPTITIYVIASSDDNTTMFKDLQYMVSQLPAVRLIPLHGSDFFDPNHYYKDMGVDRLASLAAAEHLYGGPALVIDGGTTTTTFAATDIIVREAKAAAATTTTTPVAAAAAAAAQEDASSNSAVSSPSSKSSNDAAAMWNTVRVRGGGIGPGCGAKLSAAALYSDDSGASSCSVTKLPQISHEQFKAYVQKCKQQQQSKDNTDGGGKPSSSSVLDSDESDADAMMGMVLHETTCHLHSIVATWAQDAMNSPTYQRRKRQAEPVTSGAPRIPGDAVSGGVIKTNKCLYVCITGDEGNLLLDLLKPASDAPILHPDTVLPKLPCNVEFVKHKDLIHLGIAYLLMMHEQQRRRQRQNLLANAPGTTTMTTTAPATINSDIDFRYKVMGQRVAKRRPGRGTARFVRGTVLSMDGPPTQRSVDYDDHDGSVYQIAWDDGPKEEMDGEEIYDALVLYSTQGEKQEKDRSVHETLEKLRISKCTAAKDVAKIVGQHVPAIVARIAKQEAERQAAAAAQASADNSGNGGQVGANDQATNSDVDAMEDSATVQVPPKPTAWEGTKQKTSGVQNANSNSSTVLPKSAASTWAPGSAKNKGTESTTTTTAPSAAAPASSSAGRDKRPRASSTPPTSESTKKARKKTSAKAKKTASAAEGGPLMPPTPKSLQKAPKAYEKQRVARWFDDGVLYFGTVHKYNAKGHLWRIHYDDGDKEDYDAKDMVQYGKEYEMHKNEDLTLSKKDRHRR